MKSKFGNTEKIKDPANSKNLGIGNPEESSEVDSGGPEVASMKNNKTMIIVASALLITAVLYFLFFSGNNSNKKEKLEEVPSAVTNAGQAPAEQEVIEDFAAEKKDEAELLEKPSIPEIPKLPGLSDDKETGGLPSFLDLPKEPIPVIPVDEQQSIPPIVSNPPVTAPSQNQPPVQPVASPVQPPADPKKSPIIVVGGGAGPTNSVGYENNIIQLNKDPIGALNKTEIKNVPTAIEDRTKVISQGKMLTAVLETAINTEMPGTVRGIVTRDVYGESGNLVLIPRGSRLYGSYSSQIVRGQGRVEINWSRLIRPDGVDMNITFQAADQFGRSGIEGDVDNKYGSIVGNSVLTSILAIGGAIAAEKLSGGGSVSTTINPQQGTSTTVGKASSQAIYDVSKTVIDTVQQVVGNTIDIRPVIRVPQGTRVTILVNEDIRLPPVRNYNK
jgi:type IV secretion system protein VirB10